MSVTSKQEPKTRLILVGGGHSHVQVLRRFAMKPVPGLHLTLVVDTPIAVYSGMVPGYVAGQYRAEELEIDVVPLARRAQASVILSAATRIDAETKSIHVEGRPPLRYDLASIDIGSTVAGLELPGIRDYALPTRPIAELVRRVDALVDRVASRPPDTDFSIVIVGGGAGGVELAFTLWERLKAGEDPNLHVHLVHAGKDILPGYPKSLVARARDNAKRRGIQIHCNKRVAGADANRVRFETGEPWNYGALVWVSGAVSHSMFTDSGLPTDARGFVRTRSTLQVEGHDSLFAVGDCATLNEFPETPKAGVYAVRQGPYLSENLRRAAAGRTLKRYRPQSDFLTLLNLGDGSAMGNKWGRSFEGAWVMNVKDWIDRRFMERFQVLSSDGALSESFQKLPDMSQEMEMLCGGCAAKVGQSVLERALSRLDPPPPDPSVALGLDSPDDAAAFRTSAGELILTSIDAFRAFADDPYLVGRVAAVNAISDIYATGGTPKHALALVAVPNELPPDQTEELVFQLISGARAVLDPLGITLLGGHTITAPEILIGFSIDGTATTIAAKGGLTIGDKLVVTKSLGTGVLLHADMQGRARGPWLQEALDSMARINRGAAEIGTQCRASALTDITGFGLVGHLAEMARASDVSARLDVARLPPLSGTVSLLRHGFRSTFHEENAKAKKGIVIREQAAKHEKLELAFDPQTSGGLILGISPDRLGELLEALAGNGDIATVVGEVFAKRDDGAPIELVADVEATENTGDTAGASRENSQDIDKRRAVTIASQR